ncbi:MAG: HAD-IIA family hydrolase, partial [Acidimicrobiia bacterium]|nr:HAD-IIA family hydrolase [Acidimicrobiia bacterium]
MIDDYRGFVFDLDGTLYLDDRALPGAVMALEAVRGQGKPVVFLTNKPLEPSSSYATKLTDLGITAGANEVVSSLDALVVYLTANHPRAAVLCVSEALVSDTLGDAGFKIASPDRPTDATVVVVAFDRTFDYKKLHAAYLAVNAGAVIVATNPDRYCPTSEGGMPDCAAMLAAVEACTATSAEAVVGKPSTHMSDAAISRLGMAAAEVLMVGDRIETDVAMGESAGMATCLVLSGATDRADLAASDLTPNHVI